MPVTAPGGFGRRSPWPILLGTAGFVIGGPGGGALFLFGPLLLLLLISRPARREEWFGVVILIFGIALIFRRTPTLAVQAARMGAICFSILVAATTFAGIRSLSNRLLLSATLAIAMTIGWSEVIGLRFATLREELVSDIWLKLMQIYPKELPAAPIDRATLEGMSERALTARPAMLSANVQAMGDLFPAILVLTALIGGWLAWRWYYRIVAHPRGNPPRPFDELRFNDHLVWLLIIAFGTTLFELSETTQWVASMFLFVLGALYWARGLAITRYAMALLPAPPLFKVAVTALLVLPLAFGGWLLIGVADTWLDIRRRLRPPQGVSR